MVMGSSTITSSLVWFRLLWLSVFTLLLLSTHCTATEISYNDHCSSILPESTITAPEFASLPFPPFQNGYCDGGVGLFNPNSSRYSLNNHKYLLFQTQHVYRTDLDTVFKVEGSLILSIGNINNFVMDMTYAGSFYSPRRSRRSSLSFSLKGFWSTYTGELCMVGTSSSYWQEGKLRHLTAVLQLSGVKNSSTITSLVRGTLKSLSAADDQSYFEPIYLLMFPQSNYQYTKVSNEFENECSVNTNVTESTSLSLHLGSPICSVLSHPRNTFKLEYASDCNSVKSCNPLGDEVGFLPRVMFLNTIQCSPDGQSMRLLMDFPNSSYVGFYHPFNPNTMFIGEGTWDWKKNRLCVVGCRFLNRNSSLSNSQVGDCSIRMNLRFPAIWTIRNSTSITGQIWSNKSANNIGYFKRITFQSTDHNILGVPGLKYVYTENDKVSKSCSVKKPVRKNGENYPDGYSSEMSFDMSVRNSRGEIAWGSSVPISVGDQIFQWSSGSFMPLSSSMPASSSLEANTSNSRLLNISYKISLNPLYAARRTALFNISSNEYTLVEIFAEGIYDAEIGSLCMVGCRYLGLKNQSLKKDSMDCEIRVNLQFPSLNAKKDGVYITGSISSARDKSDLLHFESVSVSSAAFYGGLERQSIWRMDMEILMVLISNTLACIFVVFQLLYVKRHPGVVPFISLLMLVVLTLGHMIILLLNFEALFFRIQNRQTVLLGSGGWLEVQELIVRIVTMVAFLLQFRLLQLSWSSRITDQKSQKASWIAEKKAWYVSLPLYLAGALISVFVNLGRKNKVVGIAMHSSRGLRSYAGLVLDGFLFPQILLNIFQNSTEKALSPIFYMGYTLIRLVPHAYDLYRAHNYVSDFDGSYIYADHRADFYSTAWDVSIPIGCILFAAILYFQQQLGGRCFLPRRFREVEGYEKVPTTSSGRVGEE
ncbi:hypothetical protein JRO89_XS15G0115600 [Xanthoceras sorbifolium]|uniref:RING-type E3 ubiquitin transferase n=1 Tax=Xanthoceras sorbifolium TaxID=99658 RepID=A0ABQ8H1T1_9ROSI|nr:hypothetical protein JRO89_XS15G0115600 [Xanthoceras sorbifolium]